VITYTLYLKKHNHNKMFIPNLVHTVVITITNLEKIHGSKLRSFMFSVWGLLQHVSVQWDHLQGIHIFKIT